MVAGDEERLAGADRMTALLARVELAREEMLRALDPQIAQDIDARLRAVGFRYVALDLRGYRLGSLNEGLVLQPVS